MLTSICLVTKNQPNSGINRTLSYYSDNRDVCTFQMLTSPQENPTSILVTSLATPQNSTPQNSNLQNSTPQTTVSNKFVQKFVHSGKRPLETYFKYIYGKIGVFNTF